MAGLFGKWHNGENFPFSPQGQGFEEVLGFNCGHWNNYFDTTLMSNGVPFKTSRYIVDFLTDAAIGFMQANRKHSFFGYIAYNTPHSPFQVPDAYFKHFQSLGLDDRLASIYGMCENLDDNIGRLLAALDELGLRQNTIVLFLCDNGPNGARFNGGLRGITGSFHEGGSRVPCLLNWPARFPKPTKVRQIPSPDRVPREEVYELSWGSLPLGTVTVPAGPARVRVQAKSFGQGEAMLLKAVTLRKVH